MTSTDYTPVNTTRAHGADLGPERYVGRKTRKYREAIEWVALNDSTDVDDPEEAGSIITAALVADLWRIPNDEVGRDVVRCRIEQGIWDR